MTDGGDQPQRRRDPLSGAWVIVAPGRQQRPRDRVREQAEPGAIAPSEGCPFCPGNESETLPPVLTLPPPPAPWSVRVVPNKYPIVTEAGAGGRGSSRPEARPARGAAEVVIETPSHDLDLPDRPTSEVYLLLAAFQQRLTALLSARGIRHVAVFKNRGAAAGTSLDHPHSQVVGIDFVPAEVRRRVQLARRFHRRDGRCLVCGLVESERRAGTRVVFDGQGYVAFALPASTVAGEVLLVPLGHAASFTTAPAAALEGLASLLVALLRRYRAAFADPAYNLVLYTAPRRSLADPAQHWYWRLAPQLTRTAGFEIGTGVLVNPLSPDAVAADLRDAVVDDFRR